MEVNKGLLAFFGEEEGAVGGVVHEEVFGEGGSGVDAPDAGGEPAGAVPGGCTVEPPPAHEVLPHRGTSRCAPGAFSLTAMIFRSITRRKGKP